MVMKSKFAWITRELLYDLYWNNQKSTVDIAIEFKTSSANINKLMRERGIPRRSFSDAAKLLNIPKKKYWQNKDWLYTEYIVNKRDSANISKEVNASSGTVRRWLKEYGIPTRNVSEAQIGKELSDTHKKRLSESHKGLKHSDEWKRKKSESSKGHITTSETRHKISLALKGPNHPLWKGGEYQRKYCYKFNRELKEEIRGKFQRKCFYCDKHESKDSRKLGIHHIDYDKLQGCKGQKWALIPLCMSCHAKTLRNKHHWFNLFINYWAYDSDINFSSYSLLF